MTTDHTHQLADSGDRLSKRASVFALLLARWEDTTWYTWMSDDDEYLCDECRRRGKHYDRIIHDNECVVGITGRALDADVDELDAIRKQLTGGEG